jgi:uncharacterized protein (TIGR03067 family)
MRAVLMIAVLAIAVPDRQDPTPKEARSLQQQLQGEWQVVAALSNGAPHPGTKVGVSVFVFKGDQMIIQRPDNKNIYSFAVDATKNPIAMDFASKNIAGKDVKGAAVPGVVKLEGDILSICVKSGGPRPTVFASPPGERIILWQMKRVKN